MTTNRLAKSASPKKRERDLSACEMAAIARENGDFDKAKLWDREAADRGEERLPNGVTARFKSDGTIEHVWFRP